MNIYFFSIFVHRQLNQLFSYVSPKFLPLDHTLELSVASGPTLYSAKKKI